MKINAIKVNVYKNQKKFELNQPVIKLGIACDVCKYKKPNCAANANRRRAKCSFVYNLARNMELPVKSTDKDGVRRVSVVLNRPWELSHANQVLDIMYKKYSR